jgi:hypothetical protein
LLGRGDGCWRRRRGGWGGRGAVRGLGPGGTSGEVEVVLVAGEAGEDFGLVGDVEVEFDGGVLLVEGAEEAGDKVFGGGGGGEAEMAFI